MQTTVAVKLQYGSFNYKTLTKLKTSLPKAATHSVLDSVLVRLCIEIDSWQRTRCI